MKVRVVVVQPFGGGVQDFKYLLVVVSARRKLRQDGEACVQLFHRIQERAQALLFQLQNSPIHSDSCEESTGHKLRSTTLYCHTLSSCPAVCSKSSSACCR